jgi:hypothetical protein
VASPSRAYGLWRFCENTLLLVSHLHSIPLVNFVGLVLTLKPFLQTMYTLEQLEQKSFRELRAIARDMALVSLGDRRCRQSWIDALVGVELPLLQLLEVSPGASIDVVENLPVADRPFEPIEPSKFGRIVYPRSAQNLIEAEAKVSQSAIAQMVKISPTVLEGDHSSPPIEEAAKTSPGVSEGNRSLPLVEYAAQTSPGVTFSSRFLALYSLPQSESICYKADTDGQLSLLDFEVQLEPEPPDPDDFESLDVFREAIALWDFEHCEPLEVSLDSFREWAPCPEDWYLAPPPTIESSDTSDFSIPIFDVAGDRSFAERKNFSGFEFDCVAERKNFSGFEFDCVAERKNFSGFEFDCVVERKNFSCLALWAIACNANDEFPIVGVGARLPLPKPPSFPPMVVATGEFFNAGTIARSATLLSARSPPGGDAVQS